jgi:hypothetical protein
MRIIVRGVLRSVIKSGAEAVEGLVTLNDIFGLENQSRLMNRMREIYLVLKLCCSMRIGARGTGLPGHHLSLSSSFLFILMVDDLNEVCSWR